MLAYKDWEGSFNKEIVAKLKIYLFSIFFGVKMTYVIDYKKKKVLKFDIILNKTVSYVNFELLRIKYLISSSIVSHKWQSDTKKKSPKMNSNSL